MFTLFDKIIAPVNIKTERLAIEDITDRKKEYFDLYTDDELNKWWGYDYKEDLGDNQVSPDYFISFMNSLKEKKEEYSLAVKLNGKMIGELVVHNFGYFADVEIGFRFFESFQGKGYAKESASALIEYLKTLGAKTIKSRCYKENLPSKRLIESLGLTLTHETDTHSINVSILIECFILFIFKVNISTIISPMFINLLLKSRNKLIPEFL